ncbi:serine/threonine-protein kinase [Nocardia donostiensis]|uniref:non-specific serine/threonine protein kinase n=1 Tax=Nocardia donostiensis TaxID=1538463 RepID=A0A1V2TL27_9NOCA|nr:serine/threonine-protein kinase [Nocardia donostiensis]ONM50188.1 serine/threonine protein kinase [Nocardia donostiensis]OQS23655.1 serine/threonine protein kinase [Nocardia donostiensis]
MTADRLIAGRYRLTDPIGTGAMGVVWRASDIRLRRTVAVKQVLVGPGLTREAAEEAKRRAMREGRIAARLHHPHAITVFDVADEDGQPWLVMEYMDAPSLASRLSVRRTLPPQEVARIGAQAASALAAAHDAGIVHRDVKPANLLVADDGTVKITDFGISRAVGDVTVTATGFLAGTPAYLSPEVARGEDPEPASDVFALGSTLYTAVTGSPPFGEGDNPLAVLHAVARGEVREPENAGALGPVLMRLLATSVQERPTMHEARRMLEDVAAGRAPKPVPAATKVLPAPGAAGPANPSGPTRVLAGDGASAEGGTGGAPAGARPGNGGGPAPSTAVPPPRMPSAAPPVPGPVAPNAATAGPAGGGSSGRGRLIMIGVAVLGVVAVLGGIIAASGGDDTAGSPSGTVASSDPQGDVLPPDPADQGTSEPGTPAEPTTSTKTNTTSASPAPTTTRTGPPSAGQAEQFVRGYYEMLPGNVSAAWSQLSPSYQAATGGYDAYSQFWSTIGSITVDEVTSRGEGQVVANLTYTLADGSVTSENRWFRVAGDDGGRLVITDSGT